MITKVGDIKGPNIDWAGVGQRIQEFRRNARKDLFEASQELNISENMLRRLEEGAESDRKSVNIIWNLVFTWNLSINWLLNNVGKPEDNDPASLMPETLIVEKGAGIRRSAERAQATEGSFSDHVLEFVMAIDKYKAKNDVTFPKWTQIYDLILALGYRKCAPARIAPLGHLVDNQIEQEYFNQIGETKAETLLMTDPEGNQLIVEDIVAFCNFSGLKTNQLVGWKIQKAPPELI